MDSSCASTTSAPKHVALPLNVLQEDDDGDDTNSYVACETPVCGGHGQTEVVTIQVPNTTTQPKPNPNPNVIHHTQRTGSGHGLELHWSFKTRAFRTCVVLGLPWGASSVLNTIFTDVRQSYMQSMGISDDVPRILPGVLTLFLGPILGAISDRSLSKWGRRNIFLVAAAIILTVSGLLFGSASMAFSDYHAFTNFLFVLLSVGVLLLNIGLRARIMDEVPIEFQTHAQAALTMWEGVGGVLGALLFRATTAAVVFSSAISGSEVLTAFGATTAAILVTIAASIFLHPEHPQDEPMFRSPLGRVRREAWNQIISAPKLFRYLCVVFFVLSFAWLSFQDGIYEWWGANVYDGCKDTACSTDNKSEYKKGLDLANTALIAQNGLEAIMSLLLLLLLPRVPDASYLKRFAVLGLSIGTCALLVATCVSGAWIPAAFAGFVLTAFYHTVAGIFPFSVVGIMGKELQTSPHGFNNNGLYVGVLFLVEALAQLTVQVYGTESLAPLGTGNVLALPCVLFVIGIASTAAFAAVLQPRKAPVVA